MLLLMAAHVLLDVVLRIGKQKCNARFVNAAYATLAPILGKYFIPAKLHSTFEPAAEEIIADHLQSKYKRNGKLVLKVASLAAQIRISAMSNAIIELPNRIEKLATRRFM